jgi:hypothetical protein
MRRGRVEGQLTRPVQAHRGARDRELHVAPYRTLFALGRSGTARAPDLVEPLLDHQLDVRQQHIVWTGNGGHTARVEVTTKRLLVALLAADTAGAAIAMKHRVAGEPFGIGASLDVRNPAVVVLWGTALSAPITSLGLATVLYRHRPGALRVLGAIFAIGALSEPVFWGRRPCPLFGRMLLIAHVVIASALALGAVGEDHRS